MKTPHKHAALIKAWADGATIEYLLAKDRWEVAEKPFWDSETHYRIKPETIRIGDVDVPKPLTTLDGLDVAFYPDMFLMELCGDFSISYNKSTGADLLRNGMLHSTKENAIIHAKALIAISGGKV